MEAPEGNGFQHRRSAAKPIAAAIGDRILRGAIGSSVPAGSPQTAVNSSAMTMWHGHENHFATGP
jgi:hypothetical protein